MSEDLPQAIAHERLADAEWLRTRYWTDEQTLDDIATELDVGQTTVREWMIRHGIDRRDNGEGRGFPILEEIPELDDAEWLRERYWEDVQPLAAIADDLGVAHSTVRRHMERLGIDRRGESGRYYQPTTGREFRCEECDARCTWNPSRTLAYGHLRNCPERDNDALRRRGPGRPTARTDGGESP